MSALRDLWRGATEAAGDVWQKMPTGMKVAVGAGGTLLAAKALLPKNLLLSSALLRAGRDASDEERLAAAGYDPNDLGLSSGSLYGPEGGGDSSGVGDSVPTLLFPLEESLQAFELGEAIKRRSVISPWDNMAVLSGDPMSEPRVPLVFIDHTGDLVADPRLYVWALPNVMQGGLFSKIGEAIKKVAGKALPVISKVAGFIPGTGPVVAKLAEAGSKLLRMADASKAKVRADAAASPGAASLVSAISSADKAAGADQVLIPPAAAAASATPIGLTAVLPPALIPQQVQHDAAEESGSDVADVTTLSAEDRDIMPAEFYDEGVGLADPRSDISKDVMLGFIPALAAAGRWISSIGSLAWPWIKKTVTNRRFWTWAKDSLFSAAKSAGTSLPGLLKFIGPKALIGASVVFYFIRKGKASEQEALAEIVRRYLEGEDKDRWNRIYEHDIKKRLTVFSKKEQEEAADLVSKAVLACAAKASLPTADMNVKRDYATLLDTVDAMKKENPKGYSEMEKMVDSAISAATAGLSGGEGALAATTFSPGSSATPYDAPAPGSTALLSPEEVPERGVSGTALLGEDAEAEDSAKDSELENALLKVGVPAAMITGVIALIKSNVANKNAGEAVEIASQARRAYIPLQL